MFVSIHILQHKGFIDNDFVVIALRYNWYREWVKGLLNDQALDFLMK